MGSRQALARVEWLNRGGKIYLPKGRINLLKRARKAIIKRERNVISKQNYACMWKARNSPRVASGTQHAIRQACLVQAICWTHVSNKWSISKETAHDTLRLYWCGVQNIATTYITGPYRGPGRGSPACHWEGPGSSKPAYVDFVELVPVFLRIFRFPLSPSAPYMNVVHYHGRRIRRSALFCYITRRIIVTHYQSFGTTYRFNLQGSRISWRWDR